MTEKGFPAAFAKRSDGNRGRALHSLAARRVAFFYARSNGRITHLEISCYDDREIAPSSAYNDESTNTRTALSSSKRQKFARIMTTLIDDDVGSTISRRTYLIRG